MKRLAILALFALLSPSALAAPRIDNAVVSDQKDGKAVKAFAPDTLRSARAEAGQ